MRSEIPLITHKNDIATANKLIDIGLPDIEPTLPYMFQWIQDINWPVAQVLVDYFSTLGSVIVPEIRRVLSTDDGDWKGACLSVVERMDRDTLVALRADLKEIAERPTQSEIDSGVDSRCRKLLRRANRGPAT